MKHHTQFFHLSTGYIPGTIPPQFFPDAKRLIPVCGSDGIAFTGSKSEAARLCAERGFLAFQIMSGPVRSPRPVTTIITLNHTEK